jgi:hypothetical protein
MIQKLGDLIQAKDDGKGFQNRCCHKKTKDKYRRQIDDLNI